MSSRHETLAPATEVARLEAEIEVVRTQSASRIKELEQKLQSFEVEKLLSTAAGSSDPGLPVENVQLRQELAATEATVERFRKSMPGLVEELSSHLVKELTALLGADSDHGAQGQAATEKYQAQNDPALNASERTKENHSKGYSTLMAGSTTAKGAAEVDPAPTGASQQTYAQASQMKHKIEEQEQEILALRRDKQRLIRKVNKQAQQSATPWYSNATLQATIMRHEALLPYLITMRTCRDRRRQPLLLRELADKIESLSDESEDERSGQEEPSEPLNDVEDRKRPSINEPQQEIEELKLDWFLSKNLCSDL